MISSGGFQEEWSQLASEQTTSDKLREAYERFKTIELSQKQHNEFVLNLSKHQNTPSEVLEDLLRNNPTSVYALEIAQNRNVNEKSLYELSIHEDPAVRYEAATKTQSQFLLENLSKDEDFKVRGAVGRNNNTTLETLNSLSEDKDWYVRSAVAANENSDGELLKILAADSESQVVRAVAHNQSASEEILKNLSKSNDEFVRHSVAHNRSASEDVLDGLVKDPIASVRTQVAKNPNTSLRGLSILSEDVNRTCKWAAKDSLEARGPVVDAESNWTAKFNRATEVQSSRGRGELER